MEGVGGQITQGLDCRGCTSWAAGAAGEAGCTLTRASPPGALAGGIQPEGRGGGGGTAQGSVCGEWAVGSSEERIDLGSFPRQDFHSATYVKLSLPWTLSHP